MKLAILISGIFLFLGCSSHKSPILAKRGVAPDERPYEVKQEGYGVDQKIKNAFLKGYAVEGMTQVLVRFLWGPPDIEKKNGHVWEYYTKKGKLVTRIIFKASEKKILGQVPLVVASFEGDPWGGSPPPASMNF
ncbi:MAG: hypothetical protein OCD01_16700 [Fibrobacterales bacterium]